MRAFSKFSHLLAGIAGLLMALGVLIHGGLPKRRGEIGTIAPPFTLPKAALDSFTLEQTRGQIAIINFWATWCVPCRAEMQTLQDLYQSHPQIRILGINLGESPQRVRQWVAELGLGYDILLDPRQSAARLYQIRGQPSTYLLDAEHRIQNIYFGPVSIDRLVRDIDRISARRP